MARNVLKKGEKSNESTITTEKKRIKKGNATTVNLIKNDFDILDEEYYRNENPEKASTKCSVCGKTFDQVFHPESKRFSSYKRCPDCRKKRDSEPIAKEDINTHVTINYSPFPSQRKIHEAFEYCRFIVINAGNRFGKDRLSIMAGIKYFFECLSENRHLERPDMVPAVYWWIVAPTERMAKQIWMELKKYFPKEYIVDISNSTFSLQSIGNGLIEVKSAYDPESLVGVGLDLVTITEAARISDLSAVWANLEARLSSPGRGRKRDRNNNRYGQGKAIINSSPIGKNFFYDMWTWGQKNHINYSSAWRSFTCPWTDNPDNLELAKSIIHTKYGDITYESDLRRRLGERTYRTNYLADFMALDGTVFKDFEEKCVIVPDKNITKEELKRKIEEWRAPIQGERYIIGYDPATGEKADNPIMVVREVTTGNVKRIINMYGKLFDEQYDTIAFWSKYYNYAPCAFGLTGHTAVEGQLSKRGVAEIPLLEQKENKSRLVSTLERAVQNESVHVFMDGTDETQTLIYEMADYTAHQSKRTNNVTYKNNTQEHDDNVSAMYFAFHDWEIPSINSKVFLGILEGINI